MGKDVTDVFAVSSSALKAQGQRMKIIAQNVANADTTPAVAGQKPYQRQVIVFKNEFDKAVGAYKVKVSGVRSDNADPIKKYDPSHPSADAQGYILKPNVNTLLETMDMNEASRSYQANVDVITASKTMVMKTIGMMQ